MAGTSNAVAFERRRQLNTTTKNRNGATSDRLSNKYMRARIQFITCEIVNLHIKCRHREHRPVIIIINPWLACVSLRFCTSFSFLLCVAHSICIYAFFSFAFRRWMGPSRGCTWSHTQTYWIATVCGGCAYLRAQIALYLKIAFSRFCWISLRAHSRWWKTFNACVDPNDTQLHIWMCPLGSAHKNMDRIEVEWVDGRNKFMFAKKRNSIKRNEIIIRLLYSFGIAFRLFSTNRIADDCRLVFLIQINVECAVQRRHNCHLRHIWPSVATKTCRTLFAHAHFVALRSTFNVIVRCM